MTAESWRSEANCLSEDPNIFFPNEGAYAVTSRHKTAIEAFRICSECAVTVECLSYANTPPFEIAGVWGGLTARARQQLRTIGA